MDKKKAEQAKYLLYELEKVKKLKTRWKKRPKIGGHFSHLTNKDGRMTD